VQGNQSGHALKPEECNVGISERQKISVRQWHGQLKLRHIGVAGTLQAFIDKISVSGVLKPLTAAAAQVVPPSEYICNVSTLLHGVDAVLMRYRGVL